MACPLQVRVVLKVELGSGMKKPLTWRGGRASVSVGGRSGSARLTKKELLMHGISILSRDTGPHDG
jgi:hypothetical protein